MSLKGNLAVEDTYSGQEVIAGSSFQRIADDYVPQEIWQIISRHPASNFRFYKASSNSLAGEPDIYAIAEVAFSGAALADVMICCLSDDLPSHCYNVTRNTLASTGQTGWY